MDGNCTKMEQLATQHSCTIYEYISSDVVSRLYCLFYCCETWKLLHAIKFNYKNLWQQLHVCTIMLLNTKCVAHLNVLFPSVLQEKIAYVRGPLSYIQRKYISTIVHKYTSKQREISY